MKPLLVQVTIGSEKEGSNLAELLIERGLAACVQKIEHVQSTYRWEGKICHENETLLLIKSSESHWEEIQAVIKQNHPYDYPEMVAISPFGVEKNYLKWWSECLTFERIR